jgi:opacity protein-like surface antigen
VAYAQSFDWSGFYVGVGVAGAGGFDKGTLSWFDPEDEIWSSAVLGDASTSDDEPFVGGWDNPSAVLEGFPGELSGFGLTGSVGFNQQMDSFLFGIEASITSGPFKSEATFIESGTVSLVTSSTETLSTTYTSESTTSTTNITYSSTTLTSNVTFTTTTTITGETDSTVTTLINTYSTYETSTVVSSTETVYFPTSETVTTTSITTTGSSTGTTFSTSTFTLSSSTSETVVSYSTNGVWTETITGRAQIDWLATIKGRIGITADRTLFFATGGLAVAGVSQETTAVLAVDQENDEVLVTEWSGSNSETRFGFVVGAGIEHALDEHWIISGEFEYFNLGTAEYDVLTDDLSQNYGHQTQVLDGGSVKLGVKYKF